MLGFKHIQQADVTRFPVRLLGTPPHEDVGKVVLRMTLGGLMLFHGLSKLLYGIDGLKGMVLQLGITEYAAYGVYAGEVLAPIFIIVGLFTRMSAAVMAFDMVVAVAMVHSSTMFTLARSGGWSIELEALYFFGCVALMFLGGGRYGINRS